MYTQVGGMISKGLDDYSNGILEQMKKVDENMIADLHVAVKANEQLLNVESQVQSIFQLQDQLNIVYADSLNAEVKHKYRDAIIRKLESLVALEVKIMTVFSSLRVAIN